MALAIGSFSSPSPAFADLPIDRLDGCLITLNQRLGGLPRRSVEPYGSPGCYFIAAKVFTLHLLYLDDSGSVGNANEDYLVLGGVSVYEAQSHYLTQTLDQLAMGIDPQDPHGVEFHASEIFARRSHPWKGLSQQDARDMIKSVLRVVADAYDTARAFACVVHKDSFPNQDPMEIAFEDLCSRFDRYLQRTHAEGHSQQRGLVILDKSTYETPLQKMSIEFRTLGTKWGVLRRLADTPFFVDSRASRLIQIADHVAYAVFRRYQHGDAQYLDCFDHRFDSEDGVIHGLSHKELGNPDCRCLACIRRESRP